MSNALFDVESVRFEISFKSFNELRKILYFYQRNSIGKINIPCKNFLKKDFLLDSIKIAREEFPNIDIIPHFSIFHEFKRTKDNTLDSLVKFLEIAGCSGCKKVLLVSGSQRRSTLDSVETLNFLRCNSFLFNKNISIGVAFNPYLPGVLFEEEIVRLEKKLQSGLVSSIWFQFGTDHQLLKNRIKILSKTISSIYIKKPRISKISLFGSILIPSRQFLARFKYRPWKGVYCSSEFLNSVEYANNVVMELLETYKVNNINPIIETNISNEQHLNKLKNVLNQ